ncbi:MULTISPECIES: alpha/beta hydrolase [Streptomyces]|uniref:Serine aminopeptidase S33 domain-containing protein n=1 Tax=Streptomyces coelicolor (strain ATCC BAA-471 / A3(2) / M145) TaxID=100226 RepID=Q9XAK3_STRCO|nr:MULTISPECIES: alpha/beta hydrolase [Streptomyces]MDX2924629.1 alpha/beta hydrolase [Streptomyces sp. NRRL_B-16638]MDX3412416.1 alpha/beta hydrolase [Streptomyces sp. ME02-6977A]MYU43122.1 alpha/beta fold hydrolase [Streptomyces sp. SID7813]NSL79092.1 alpha/beta hydrolase [Streptomyces coelicolor]QFI43622.1 alpha/beta hydrolase [Streptomyces coelicolor A3(2)]
MPETDLTVTADDGTSLAGTLSLPAGPGPHPAVLLLHGSGPLDREGNTPRLPLNLGRPLADALAAAGVAALRYDRRGAGSTPGVWEESGFTDNRRDASAALRALAAHPDIRPDAVGVVGHSEGALHAMTLAARQEVAAVVLLAGFARGGEAAFRWQAASVFGGMPAPVRLLRRPLGALGERVLARVKRTRTDVARIAGLRVNARWVREMLVHDTRDDLAAVPAAVPVLAVTGDKDVQVPPADLDEIRRLVPGGHTEIHRVPDLTHVLRRDTGRPTLRSYRRLLREPVDPELLALVATWLQARLREPSGAPAEERRTTRS